ncbi:hypothetical protein B4113_1443 [Geobacillus sp. B4113_201601]|nr:hypothetical protein B4113_1443 [Geobacillus sp. B4113_201601]
MAIASHSGRFTENRDVVRIAAKRLNVLLHLAPKFDSFENILGK